MCNKIEKDLLVGLREGKTQSYVWLDYSKMGPGQSSQTSFMLVLGEGATK